MGAGAGATRPDPWVLVGRDEELELLEVESGAGPVVVAGPAGVGKTRLLTDWVARSGRPAVEVVATHATASVPFGAFARWFGPADGRAPDRLAALRTLAARLGAMALAAIVVDDGHLLDEGSAALVLELARHGEARVVVAVRSGEPCPDPITALWKDGIGTRIDLKPLAELECTTLLDRRLGGRVHSATAARLWALSAGNPMYLREVTEAALDQGQLVDRDGTWSWTGELSGSSRLGDLVRARIGRVDDGDRGALELVALGEPLPLPMAEALLPAGQLARLEARGLLAVSVRHDVELVSMVHPLYGEVVRAEVPVLALRAHHRTLAAAGLAHGLDQRDPLRLARWLRSGGGAPAEAPLLVSASHRALVLQDYDLAIELATAAAELGGGLPARLARARALGLRGDHREMADTLTEAAALASGPDEVAEVAVMRVITTFWRDHSSASARAVLDEVLDGLGPTRAAPAVATGACAALLDLDLATARDLAGRVEAVGATAGPRLTAATVDVWAAVLQGRPTVLAARFEELGAGTVGLIGTDPLPAAYLAIAHGLGARLSGRLDDAERLFEGLVDRDIGNGVGDQLFLATPLLLLAHVSLARGRVRTAAERGRRALELMGEDRPYLLARPVAAAGVAAAATAQAGDPVAADEVLARVERRYDIWVPEVRAVLDLGRAWALAARGALGEGRRLAVASAEHLASAGAHGLEVFALLEATRLGGAASAAPRLRHLVARVDGPLVDAAATLAAALAERSGADLDAASLLLEEVGADLVAAEASAQAAPAHAAHGLRRAEAASRRRALELAARCEGAVTPLLAGLDHPVTEALTAREREVALLVAAGSTNRTAADALGVSLRTVNSHLNHAYAKLGTSDREELARILGLAESRSGPR